MSKIVAVASVAMSVFKCFNLDLNFAAGKSEGMLSLKGQGKKKSQRSLVRNGNCVYFKGPDGRLVCLRFVTSYKHVGTKATFDGKIGDEVGTR